MEVKTNSSITFGELAARWLSASTGEFDEPTLLRAARQISTHLTPWFDGTTHTDRPDAITSDAASAFRAAKLAGGHPSNEVDALLGQLKRILDFGAARGLCPKPAWTPAQLGTASLPTPVILTPEQEHQLTAYLLANPHPLHTCIHLILATGLTTSEALSIRGRDINLRRRTILIHTARSTRTRSIPLTEPLLSIIKKAAVLPDHYLCTGKPTPYQRDSIELYWKRISQTRLLPPMQLKDLRHTFAVHALQSGMSYTALSSRLGIANSRYFRSFYESLLQKV